MVLGLIEFLVGGKKSKKVPKTAQANVAPVGNSSGTNQAGQDLPDGVQTPTQNSTPPQGQELKFQDSTQQQNVNSSNTSQPQENRKPISAVIHKIHDELKSTNERISELVGDVKNIENSVNTLGHRVDEIEESKKASDEKVADFENNMNKFLSLYELINNQYNPFVEKEEVKKVVLSDGSSSDEISSEIAQAAKTPLSSAIPEIKEVESHSVDDSLLSLDTLNIEEAAGDAVPLTKLKNNTNSLVIILSWLEYLIKKVGIDETRNTLRYYTEVLRWTTPEVYFDLDKYLRGMRDKANVSDTESLTVKDHIVSLYFISKLNEKTLDDKLTKAVLQIIKQ